MTKYSSHVFQVTYTLAKCSNFILSTTATGRTGYGVPDPVTTAYVEDTSKECIVFWQHNSTDQEIVSYRVKPMINAFYI